MANGANKAFAILIMVIIAIMAFLLMINKLPSLLEIVGGHGFGISFKDITSIQAGFWIITLRFIVAPALMVLCGWVIRGIIVES